MFCGVGCDGSHTTRRSPREESSRPAELRLCSTQARRGPYSCCGYREGELVCVQRPGDGELGGANCQPGAAGD
jgi:hypothetical protein